MDWIKDTACEYSGQWCDECVDVEDGDINDSNFVSMVLLLMIIILNKMMKEVSC